jgi:hypothetical protein
VTVADRVLTDEQIAVMLEIPEVRAILRWCTRNCEAIIEEFGLRGSGFDDPR